MYIDLLLGVQGDVGEIVYLDSGIALGSIRRGDIRACVWVVFFANLGKIFRIIIIYNGLESL